MERYFLTLTAKQGLRRKRQRNYAIQNVIFCHANIALTSRDTEKASKSGMRRKISVTVLVCAAGLEALSGSLAWGADAACFTAAKTYRVHALRGGDDKRDGWAVKGGAFSECVHRAETADKQLRSRYPDTIYQLSLAATAGCHGC
ncbi:MAG TPA: hypothetical protein VN723_14605 [Rhizomicrobium sp.]|nr:hypothetical protein [Rhizomicrobium sp.]